MSYDNEDHSKSDSGNQRKEHHGKHKNHERNGEHEENGKLSNRHFY